MRIFTSSDGISITGSSHSITCVLTKPASLLATPDMAWISPAGTEVTGQVNNTLVGTMTAHSVTVEQDPLLASLSGVYTCQASLQSPALLAPLNLSSIETVTVQRKSLNNPLIICNLLNTPVFSLCTVPHPRVEVTTLLGSPPFYAGSALTLRCSVQVDVTVDIPYRVTLAWLKSGTPISSNNRTAISNATQMSPYTYESTLGLNPLSSTSDTGTYTCQVEVTAGPAMAHILGSTQRDTESILVQGTEDCRMLDTEKVVKYHACGVNFL